MSPSMTGAELRAHRCSLGLSVRDLADLLAVHERTIRHWETERSQIAPGAADEVRALTARTGAWVRQCIQEINGQDSPAITIPHPAPARSPIGPALPAEWWAITAAAIAAATGARITWSQPR